MQKFHGRIRRIAALWRTSQRTPSKKNLLLMTRVSLPGGQCTFVRKVVAG